MTNVLLIGLRVNWLLSRCSVGWGGGRGGSGTGLKGGGSTAGGQLPSVQVCDLWTSSSTASARHNKTSPFMSHLLKRNPITTIHQPIKKLCIIYHVIWQHNQIEYDLQLNVRNFHSASKDKGGKMHLGLLPDSIIHQFKTKF